ncbi:MAG: hypothetical protein AB7E24_17125 [Novosphingobium sp.]|jgi:hypothetical protein
MISFRVPWYTLGLGTLILVIAGLLPLSDAVKWPMFLASGFLLLDGGLGLRTLPRLVPFASFPEDWQQIEREMYVGQIGLIRWTAAVIACLCLALAGITLPEGAWQIWSVVSLMAVSGIVWTIAALKVIREVLGND